MEFFDSYTSAFQTSISSNRFSVAHLFKLKKNMNIDTSGCYKVFFLISGSKKFHIDNNVYNCLPGDVFLVSPKAWHYFSDFSAEEVHERIVIFISPAFLKACSSDLSDLSLPFSQIENGCAHVLSLSSKERERFMYYAHKLSHNEGFGADLVETALFTQLMVFLSKIFFQHLNDHPRETLPAVSYSSQVDRIISYINQHLSEELSIQMLAEQFYLSPTYLCRIFKTATGTTPHKYINAQRITLAKELLAEGYSSVSVCSECGFNDYGNFLKIFKKAVGISPKKYAQLSR